MIDSATGRIIFDDGGVVDPQIRRIAETLRHRLVAELVRRPKIYFEAGSL